MKRLKMPTSYTLLFMIIVVIALLTWVIPGGVYETTPEGLPIAGTYSRLPADEQTPQGLWEIVNAPVQGFFNAIDVSLFIIVIGGFLGIIMKTGAIDAGITLIIKKLQGREQLLIPILMVIFAIGGSTYGMAEETLAFYPILIPILLAAGYDTITAVAVIALGSGIGIIGSTVNPFATGIASGFAGVSIGEGIGLRLIILAVNLGIAIFYVMRYAKKIKENPSLSLVANMREENKKHFLSKKQGVVEFTGRRKMVLAVFVFTFVFMILGVIPWGDRFGITFFEETTYAMRQIPWIGKILGDMVPLGDWWFGELTALFLTSSILVAFIYKMEEGEFIQTFVEGAKDLLGVALIVSISRGITVVMDAGGMTATVLNWGEGLLDNMHSVLFVNAAYLFYIPLSILVPSSSGLATLSMPIMAPLTDFAGVSRELIVTIYQSALGVTGLITPTSAVIMGALSIARVPYTVYVKLIWKLVLIIALVTMTMISIAALLG